MYVFLGVPRPFEDYWGMRLAARPPFAGWGGDHEGRLHAMTIPTRLRAPLLISSLLQARKRRSMSDQTHSLI